MKKLVEKSVEECTETEDDVKMATKITLTDCENKHKNNCSSCTLYIVFQ